MLVQTHVDTNSTKNIVYTEVHTQQSRARLPQEAILWISCFPSQMTETKRGHKYKAVSPRVSIEDRHNAAYSELLLAFLAPVNAQELTRSCSAWEQLLVVCTLGITQKNLYRHLKCNVAPSVLFEQLGTIMPFRIDKVLSYHIISRTFPYYYCHITVKA